MILLFDSNRLEGLVAIERSKVASALAQILMQAAGVRVEELDDDEVPEPIPPAILKRKAVLYVRQSSQSQVQTNLESKRRQYDLVDVARQPRQVLLSMTADGVHFPRQSDEGRMTSFEWMPIRYRNVIAILRNPFYAGVYVYGKSEKRTALVDGRARRSYGHSKPIGTREVMIRDHHEGYISWEEYERNQKQLALNDYRRAGGVKSGRGGRALLSGMMICGRCGRRLSVTYTGNRQSRPVYRCDKPNLTMGLPRCMTFGGPRVDAAIARELLRAVEPMAIEAAFEAERMHREQQEDQHRILDVELQQARYEARLAERRYAACDPDNRLIAAQLEKNCEQALRRVKELETRQLGEQPCAIAVAPDALADLVGNLSAAWNAPGVTMRARQQRQWRLKSPQRWRSNSPQFVEYPVCL